MSQIICIFTAKLARKLLRDGYTIVDIEPNKDNPERTVFYFKYCEKLESALKYLNSKKTG